MSNLKDFIKSQQNKSQALIGPSSTLTTNTRELANKISNCLVTAKTTSLSSSDSEKFGHEVVKVAHSDEVISELSREIGKPKESETENEFVNRGKLALANILRKKLL
ncbi:hypothetical protein [Aeromonas allosaccharophila]|uniref:hypothetical protein n=1 Tax=Aeromonas allosaccharophila TaxID=656 RepID=UPI0034137C15